MAGPISFIGCRYYKIDVASTIDPTLPVCYNGVVLWLAAYTHKAVTSEVALQVETLISL